jgi:hypothetical protein
MSIEMLELAQVGGWDEAIAWEQKRQALLEELFQSAPPSSLAPLLAEAISATLASDGQLKELARLEMDKLGDYLKSFGLGRRARQAYQYSP